MVLTRLSHVGEVCPLSDHSYSDPVLPSSSQISSNRRFILAPKGSPDGSLVDNDKSSSVTTMEAHSTNPHDPSESTDTELELLQFPTEVLEKIFSYLTFTNIREIRRVCRRFEKIGATLLNITFQKLQNQMLIRFQTTKSQMPRRESARRKHPLARESDILETLHMRLTLLQMTFGKHIERKHCCFFAGEILDEVYRILRCVKTIPNMGKVFKITDELFDLSTMAMEYFKEHIEPSLPEIPYFGSDLLDITSRFSEGGSSRSSGGSGRMSDPEDDFTDRELPSSNIALRKRVKKIRQGMKRYSNQLSVMKREMRACRTRITDQNKQLMEYLARMEEYDRKIDDSTRKFGTVLQELNKCKTELQYWRSKSPLHPICMHCHLARFPNGERPGVVAAEAVWSHRELDDQLMLPPLNLPQARPIIPYYSSSSIVPSPPPSVNRNFEPLFDVETADPLFPDESTESNSSPPPTSCSSSTCSSCSPFSSSTSSFSNSSLLLSLENDFGERADGGHHKRCLSDEDTELDIDTVGRRVKERKRIKLDPHSDL